MFVFCCQAKIEDGSQGFALMLDSSLQFQFSHRSLFTIGRWVDQG